ncbi:MAG TPA: hypothetical protein VKU41_27730, partial [Polyangiaceae bacterium]|nr:hypothetical protein [Polyangiaceae bacterium]
WAHEVDIFRSWRLIDPASFSVVQTRHWRKLPFWVFAPVGLEFAGAIALLWFHPAGSPPCGFWGGFACQLASHVLTAILWGRWQAKLSKDARGSKSPYLGYILKTHWVRTLLVNAAGFVYLAWLLELIA